MLSLPSSTVFDKRVPKQRFYDKLKVSHAMEQRFVQEIDNIRWTHKLAPDTLNVQRGEHVTEIQIFEITLKQGDISKATLEFIDREIPYHLVFVLRYAGQAQIWMSYKEASKNREGKFRVETYYNTEWQRHEDLNLELRGLDLDRIYESFLCQVAGDRLLMRGGANLRQAIERTKEIDKLEAIVSNLEKKMQNERQFNVQVELRSQLRAVQLELVTIMEEE